MGVREKNDFFRPDVPFGVDARCLLNRLKDGKRFQETDPLGVLPPFGVRYCPQWIRDGSSNMGKALARAFLHANSVLRRAKDFRMPKNEVNPHSLPIPTLICYLFSKFEE